MPIGAKQDLIRPFGAPSPKGKTRKMPFFLSFRRNRTPQLSIIHYQLFIKRACCKMPNSSLRGPGGAAAIRNSPIWGLRIPTPVCGLVRNDGANQHFATRPFCLLSFVSRDDRQKKADERCPGKKFMLFHLSALFPPQAPSCSPCSEGSWTDCAQARSPQAAGCPARR